VAVERHGRWVVGVLMLFTVSLLILATSILAAASALSIRFASSKRSRGLAISWNAGGRAWRGQPVAADRPPGKVAHLGSGSRSRRPDGTPVHPGHAGAPGRGDQLALKRAPQRARDVVRQQHGTGVSPMAWDRAGPGSAWLVAHDRGAADGGQGVRVFASVMGPPGWAGWRGIFSVGHSLPAAGSAWPPGSARQGRAERALAATQVLGQAVLPGREDRRHL